MLIDIVRVLFPLLLQFLVMVESSQGDLTQSTADQSSKQTREWKYKEKQKLRESLTPLQFHITQEKGTEKYVKFYVLSTVHEIISCFKNIHRKVSVILLEERELVLDFNLN